ncbi:MAG: hypothetical protein HYU73_07345 [Betaproteobacteria bacterium]|nr:hypothetical protein [Betaproteobacteria bacterium]MBI3055466.1 hypothetical protein [Betaproteobacteria bacterium]
MLANSPSFSLGIPSVWVADWWIIERGVVAEHFPNDPPIYEAEATYLKRNKLLLEREGARLTVADFEPQALPAELWPIFDELHTAQAELDQPVNPDELRPDS